MTKKAPRKKQRGLRVSIDSRKVFILSSCIIVICVFFLLLNTLLRDTADTEPTETYIYIEENAHITSDKEKSDEVTHEDDPQPVQPESHEEAASIAEELAPKEEKQEQTTAPAFSIPPAQNNARLAFIIDDAGQSVARLKPYTELPFPLTIAVLPGLVYTADCSDLVRRSGKELMLHQPMQAENLAVNPGPCSIQPVMTVEETQSLIRANLAQLGEGVKGLNNHEGSLITENEVLIGAVLDVAREDGLYFVDSRTTMNTQAPAAAAARNMVILSRDVFLDNVTEREEILVQLLHGLALANKHGTAIMIGHVDKSVDVLPALLADIYPQLAKSGYVFVTPSQLLQ